METMINKDLNTNIFVNSVAKLQQIFRGQDHLYLSTKKGCLIIGKFSISEKYNNGVWKDTFDSSYLYLSKVYTNILNNQKINAFNLDIDRMNPCRRLLDTAECNCSFTLIDLLDNFNKVLKVRLEKELQKL